MSQELTPWSGNGNEVFWTYKAHTDCDRIYSAVGEGFDWELPGTRSNWKDYVEACECEQKRNEGAWMDKPNSSYEHLNKVADWIDEQARMLDQEAYPAWAEKVR